ncbi:hypothetical protein RG903_08065 [Thermithiobacillus tepidarius DSM 3134]|uniref:hypothetical protein n=1 Tax=Thermithiobacillus tepidarius TaxID=929 RepID=UPI003AAF8A42
MHRNPEFSAVIKATIRTYGICAVPFFALQAAFPLERGNAATDKNRVVALSGGIVERVQEFCRNARLECSYDYSRKVAIFGSVEFQVGCRA